MANKYVTNNTPYSFRVQDVEFPVRRTVMVTPEQQAVLENDKYFIEFVTTKQFAVADKSPAAQEEDKAAAALAAKDNTIAELQKQISELQKKLDDMTKPADDDSGAVVIGG